MFKKYRPARRGLRGVSLAEAAAAICVLTPIMILIIYGAMEASYGYMIKNCLSQAARQAARDLAICYGQDADVAVNRSKQEAQVFNNIRIDNMLNSSQQFDEVTFNTASDPATVEVTVRYLGGQYGLPPFPNPDPLKLGSNYVISATSTYRLE